MQESSGIPVPRRTSSRTCWRAARTRRR